MQQSPLFQRLRQQHLQEGIQQGIEQGARENAIENIIAVLSNRFPRNDVNTVKEALEMIDNIERLKQLNISVSLTPSFEDFMRALET